MLTWGLLPIRLGLAFFVYLSLLVGQIDLLEDFDPEQSIPESDLFILSTAQNLHKGLTAQSAHLLIQLSILTKEEINALDGIVNGKASVQIEKYPRLSKIIKTLWPKETSESITGAILYKMNVKDDIQYKWSGEVNLHNINIGFLGERDGYEKNILDHRSLFIQKHRNDKTVIIGDFQMLLGHGLVSWRSMPLKSYFGVTNSALRTGRGVQPFRSGHESWSYRGLAWSQKLFGGEFSGAVSKRWVDGTLTSMGMNLSESGMHISDHQIENKSNILESVFITNWRSDKEKLNYGFILGKGTWIDRNSISFANTLLSFYSSFTAKNINIYNELALSVNNRNAVISGLRIKNDLFGYGLIFRYLEPGYIGIRENMFRNWDNISSGESGFLHELHFRTGRIKVNVYSDAFHRLQEEPGIFKKRGSETGGRLELKPHQEWIINAQFKQQYASTEINTYPNEIAEVGRPVTTLRSTIKREWSKKHKLQFQIQSKFETSGDHISNGLQIRYKIKLKKLMVNTFWMSSHINNYTTRLYYWDATLPGEMRSKLFSESGHYAAIMISLLTIESSAIHGRISTSWDAWEFNAKPQIQGALQFNLSL